MYMRTEKLFYTGMSFCQCSTDTLLKIHTDTYTNTDILNLYWYQYTKFIPIRYQILIPSLRFMPIPIPISFMPNHTDIIPIPISGFPFIPILILILGFLSYWYPKFKPIPIPDTNFFFWHRYLVSISVSGIGWTLTFAVPKNGDRQEVGCIFQ